LRGPAAAAECELVSRSGGDWRGGHCAKKATSASEGALARAAGPQSALTRQSIVQARLMGMSFGPVGRWIETIDGAPGLLARLVIPSELSGNHAGCANEAVVSGEGLGGCGVSVTDGVSAPLGGGVLSVVFWGAAVLLSEGGGFVVSDCGAVTGGGAAVSVPPPVAPAPDSVVS